MRRLLFIFICLGICFTNTYSQTNQESAKDSTKIVVEQMPSYPGGEEAMYQFLDKNLVYPKKAKQKNIQGKVWVSFIIDTYGNVSHVTLKQGIGGGCDEEALRVVSMMPRWNPGKQDGITVNVKYNFPINFVLTK